MKKKAKKSERSKQQLQSKIDRALKNGVVEASVEAFRELVTRDLPLLMKRNEDSSTRKTKTGFALIIDRSGPETQVFVKMTSSEVYKAQIHMTVSDPSQGTFVKLEESAKGFKPRAVASDDGAADSSNSSESAPETESVNE